VRFTGNLQRLSSGVAKDTGQSINNDLRDSHQLRDSALFKPDCIFYNKEIS